MNKSFKDRIARYRALSQNPYALLEYLEEPDGVMAVAAGAGSPIAASRRMLEDPYAYLDVEGASAWRAQRSVPKHGTKA